MPYKFRNKKHVTLPVDFKPGFLHTLDRRTELSRALKERFANIATDLGGASELSAIKVSLIERYVWLEAIMGTMEEQMSRAGDAKAASEMIGRWLAAVNSLSGLAKTLGLDRKAHSMPWITHTELPAATKKSPAVARPLPNGFKELPPELFAEEEAEPSDD